MYFTKLTDRYCQQKEKDSGQDKPESTKKSLVLSGQAKEIDDHSTESLARNLSVKTLYTLDKQKEGFVTDSQSIEAMFPKRNLTKYVGNISINLAIHS